MDTKEIEKKILEDPILSKLSILAKDMNVPLFLVGGYIRDLFLGTHRPGPRVLPRSLPPAPIQAGKDYDFALAKDAFSFISIMEKALDLRFFKVGKEELGKATFRITNQNVSMDITFFQGRTIEEDLQKRDFTINAVAFSLLDEKFQWVEGALEDMEKRVIRTVTNRSIDQDPLRMLRAVRYLCTLESFFMDIGLREEISLKKEQINKLPGERIKMELDQILLSPRPEVGMKSLYELGLLLTLFPELKGLENLGQSEHHHLNVLSHTLLMVEKISWASEWIDLDERKIHFTQEDWLSLYYAALFHDMGKQDTFSKDEKERVHFYHHESYSCQRAESIMEKLRFSNPARNKILRLIQNHMRILNLSQETKETALKRLVNQIGDDIPLLVLHTLADKEASRGILSTQMDEVIENHCLRILELFREKEIVHPSPFITGHDVIALGYPPGPRVGQILNCIREKQVEGEIRTREEALKVLKEKFGA